MYIHAYIKKTSRERLSLKKKFHFKFRSLDYDSDVLCKSFKEKRNKVVQNLHEVLIAYTLTSAKRFL